MATLLVKAGILDSGGLVVDAKKRGLESPRLVQIQMQVPRLATRAAARLGSLRMTSALGYGRNSLRQVEEQDLCAIDAFDGDLLLVTDSGTIALLQLLAIQLD